MNDLTRPQIEDLLREAGVVHLAVVEEDGTPYISPLSFVFDDGAIAFRTLDGRRLRAIRNNPRVCAEVTRYDAATGDWRSVVGFGDAEVVDDKVVEGSVISQLFQKYDETFKRLISIPSDPPGNAAFVVRVHLDSIEGRTSGQLFGSKTRPGRL